MSILIKKGNYADFAVFQQNRMKHRAYFIPFEQRELLDKTPFRQERGFSDRTMLLSGEWGFRYFAKRSEMPDSIDSKNFLWDKIAVPSTWQHTGYEKPFYLNRRYQFDKKPPNIPADVPVGVYHKTFDINEVSKNTIITFLGVCSCVDLFVNGEYIGFSEVSHNVSEFDLSNVVRAGANEIIAVVYKFCNGSYLECQDMYRDNGIFRDVFLTFRKDAYIQNFGIATPFENGEYTLQANVDFVGADGQDCLLELVGANKKIDATAKIVNGKISVKMAVGNVNEWSAEAPNLYQLFITLKDSEKNVECVRTQVGFKHIKIVGNTYFFNGAKIKMLGVNHHDSNPYNGYVMTLADMEKDLMVMKQFNVNTIRTSHYPKDPLFLQLCNEYGFYVCDEADIETHGFYNIPGSASGDKLSDDPAWESRYVDRVMGMVSTDINNPCVAMWSLGNESGGIANQNKCDAQIKLVSNIPVHYEGAVYKPQSGFDVVSQMYPRQHHVKAICEGTADARFLKKPYFMCEYAHSMGLGAGSYKEYWEPIYNADIALGGCVWEFCDHSAYDADGRYKWTYGGDYGEFIHDKNFCVDGLFFPDRTPHTGAYQMRHFYCPIRVKALGDDKYEVLNGNYFNTTKDISIQYKVVCAGLTESTGSVSDIINPRNKVVVSIPTNGNADTVVQFAFYKDKQVIGEAEFEVTAHKFSKIETAKVSAPTVTKSAVTFSTEGVKISFDTKTGAISSYQVDGIEVLGKGGSVSKAGVSRCLIDNEMFISILFKIIGFNDYKTKCSFKSAKCKDGVWKISVVNSLYRFILGDGPKFKIEYSVFGDGSVVVRYKIVRSVIASSFLPKVGFSLQLDSAFDNVRYFAKGERENYSDFADSAMTGIYTTTVAENHQAYIKPQENGNHTAARWAEFVANDGVGIKFVAVDELFNLNFHDYALEDIKGCLHIEDLVRGGKVCVNIDGYTRGVGSNSCGPLPLAKYTFKDKSRTYAFKIEPIRVAQK